VNDYSAADFAPSRINVDLYTLAMRRLRKRLIRDLIAGPGAAASASDAPRTMSVLLRLVARARDGDSQSVIVEQRESVSSTQLETILTRAARVGAPEPGAPCALGRHRVGLDLR
jgi:hypothetical protein